MDVSSRIGESLRRAKALADAIRGQELPRVRVSSVLQATTPRVPRALIPADIHQTWSDNLFGRTHAQGLRDFRIQNPGFSFRIWSEEEVFQFMRDNFGGTDIAWLFERARFGPVRTDIWRYCLLLIRGGWYFDINKRVSGSVQSLVEDPMSTSLVLSYEGNAHPAPVDQRVAGMMEHPDRVVVNWGLASIPGHPLWERVIDDISSSAPEFCDVRFEDVKSAILRFSGPIRLTRTFHSYLGDLGTSGIEQVGIDFRGRGDCEMAGSKVRYLTAPPYGRAQGKKIIAS